MSRFLEGIRCHRKELGREACLLAADSWRMPRAKAGGLLSKVRGPTEFRQCGFIIRIMRGHFLFEETLLSYGPFWPARWAA